MLQDCISPFVVVNVLGGAGELLLCRAAVESTLTFSILMFYGNMTTHKKKIQPKKIVCTLNFSLPQSLMTE